MLERGLENVLAFHTLSKRSAMTGYRSGFMAGDARLIEALRRFRPNVGVATPDFVQRAAIAAWNDDAHAADQRALYAAKRALLLDEFARRGWSDRGERGDVLPVGARAGRRRRGVRRAADARRHASRRPARSSAPGGEGYVRWALVPTLEECREALRARLETRDERERASADARPSDYPIARWRDDDRRARTTGTRPLDDPAVRGAVEGAIAGARRRRPARRREAADGEWITHGWLQQAIVLYFRLRVSSTHRGRAVRVPRQDPAQAGPRGRAACASCRPASRATARSSSAA